ncbi:MAG: ParB/RepB/Spo0J family partition protein [Rhodocyclaceae bacterium]|nr:ParB/RepB/Spo0J family partition protein [Rhodocyclaceae bacterium]
MSLKGLKSIVDDFNAAVAEEAGTGAKARAIERAKSAPVALMEFSAEFRRLAEEKEELQRQLGQPQRIALQSIVDNPLHERVRKLNPEQVDALAENLRHNPLATPIVVRKLENGHFEVIAGRHRVQAYRILGRTQIEAVVVDLDDDASARALVFDNLIRPELSDYERYAGIAELRRRFGWSYSQIADETGLSKGWISALMQFDRLAPEAHEALRRRPDALSAKQLQQLLELSANNHAALTRAVEALAQGASFAEVCASLSSKPSRTRTPSTEIRDSLNRRLAALRARQREIVITLDKSVAQDCEQVAQAVHAALQAWAAKRSS